MNLRIRVSTVLSNKNEDTLKVIRKFGRILILTELILSGRDRGGSGQCSKYFSIWSSKLAKLHLKRSLNLSMMQTPRSINLC